MSFACGGPKRRFIESGPRPWVPVDHAEGCQPFGLGCVGECCTEEAVGPLFGEAAGVGEDEVDFGVAHFQPGELVGESVAVAVLQLEECRVSGFDEDGGERERGKPLHLEGERSVGERGGEVLKALALEHAAVGRMDGVVAGGNGRPYRLR